MVNTVQRLLAVLADGEFHSGEELGELLGVSRTAVWKHLHRLEALSLPIKSVKGRGYCLAGGLELLSKDRIKAGLLPQSQGFLTELQVLPATDSTNNVARARAEHGDATGLVILAEQQTAGRGRRGRQWVSPFARNIYLSTVWGFEEGAAALEGLSLAAGVAVKRAVERCGVNGVQLKWPNDVLYQRQKLGGVLLEMIGDPAGFCQVVVGIGLNIAMPGDQAVDIEQSWTDIATAADTAVSRNQVAVELLNELLPVLASYQQKGFSAYREEWQGSDAFRGEQVRLVTPSVEISGIAAGVSDSGAICLEIGDERRYFNGGEISLRSAE